MGRVSDAFARLSPRERLLVSVMVGLLFLVVVFLVNLWLGGAVNTLEENVSKERDALAEIYASTDDFLANEKAFSRTRKQAIKNAELNLTTAVAEVANEISLEAIDRYGNPDGKRRVKAFLEFKGQKETPLSRKKRRDKDSNEGYYRRSQEVTIKENATFAAIYELLEKIEESRDLLFITELRLERSRNQPDRVRSGKIVVSTYFYQESDS